MISNVRGTLKPFRACGEICAEGFKTDRDNSVVYPVADGADREDWSIDTFHCAYCGAKVPEWSVTVGNVGTVYRGDSEECARDEFRQYVRMSAGFHGGARCLGEPVVLFDGEGEPAAEFNPPDPDADPAPLDVGSRVAVAAFVGRDAELFAARLTREGISFFADPEPFDVVRFYVRPDRLQESVDWADDVVHGREGARVR